jgi:hypothetical protein
MTLGILTLILAVSAYAEKSNGDHHLPERYGRIALTAIAFLGLIASGFRKIPVVPGCTAEEHRHLDVLEHYRMRGSSFYPGFTFHPAMRSSALCC